MKQRMLNSARQAAGWLPDALLTGGAGAVAYGAHLVHPAAGFVVGGLFALAAGWLLSRASAKAGE